MSTTRSTSASLAAGGRGRSLRASGPLLAWRTVDILTVAFLGAAVGIAYWAWDQAYVGPATALQGLFPPLQGITSAPWLLAGVLGGLVVRRPGAAFACETVAALVSMLPGTKWGTATLVSGMLQGAGAELGFLLLAYGSFGIGAAMLAGALAAPFEVVYEWFAYWADWGWGWKLVYGGVLTVSGALIAGTLAWLLTRALARAGALGAFPSGQEVREARGLR